MNFIKQEGKFQLEAIIGYTNNYTNITKLYTNNIPQEKGTHLTGFKTAWTQGLNQFARNKNLLKDKDSNLTGSDLEEGQIIILNFKKNTVVYICSIYYIYSNISSFNKSDSIIIEFVTRSFTIIYSDSINIIYFHYLV